VTVLPKVTITPAAQMFMRRMVRFGGEGGDAGFRLTVTAGGCSGYDVTFGVERAPHAGDATVDLEALRVFLPAESRLLLDGCTVDFADTPASTGLSVNNPTAGPCGCASGSVAPGAPGVATVRLDAVGRRPVR
jgi:iron-sulfur cluster assembly accessory protein